MLTICRSNKNEGLLSKDVRNIVLVTCLACRSCDVSRLAVIYWKTGTVNKRSFFNNTSSKGKLGAGEERGEERGVIHQVEKKRH
jgi:hypothetical protein